MLLLDEPTAALDPAAARATRAFVDELRREGKAILLTTHNMHEADEVCDRVGIIEHGRLIAEDRPADLIKRAGVEPRLELMLRGDTSAARAAIGDAALWWGQSRPTEGFRSRCEPPTAGIQRRPSPSACRLRVPRLSSLACAKQPWRMPTLS